MASISKSAFLGSSETAMQTRAGWWFLKYSA